MIVKDTSCRGFTLIELIVVLAVFSLAYAVLPPLFSNSISSAELKSAARQIASALRATRAEAIAKNSEVLFTLDLKQRQFQVAHQQSHALPSRLELTLRTAESERVNEALGRIRFFPDGSSTGGGITVANEQRKIQVAVEWLTGRVEILE